jgi:hypothetical protein
MPFVDSIAGLPGGRSATTLAPEKSSQSKKSVFRQKSRREIIELVRIPSLLYSFAIRGRRRKSDFLRSRDIVKHNVDTARAAIALHTTPGIPPDSAVGDEDESADAVVSMS